jgi:hypothetical protein
MNPLSRLNLLICLLAGVAFTSAADQNPVQPIPWAAPTGSVALWNGKDLTGWTPFFKGGIAAPTDFWSGTNGVLHLSGKPTGYIRTAKSYGYYHLHAEWRWAGTPAKGTNNSGIFVLQHPPDVVWPYSVQVQVKAGSCGDLISQGGLLFPPPNPNPTMKKLSDKEKPVGEWNGYDIYCTNNAVQVYVNGVLQNSVTSLPTDTGQIALQMEGYPIDFRNIWLEQLDILRPGPASSPSPSSP